MANTIEGKKTSTTSERLKQIMEERNLTQADILRLCEPYYEVFDEKLSRSLLSQYVTGRNLPKQKKLLVLSNGLQVSVSWLLGYDIEKSTFSLKTREIASKIEHLSLEDREKVASYIDFLLTSTQ